MGDIGLIKIMGSSFYKQNHTRYVFWVGYLFVFLIPLFLITYDLSVPGLYYDEVLQAIPAKEFVDNIGSTWDFPGKVSIEIFKRPFPLMTQFYMGALKSQLLIPVFAFFGTSILSLRIATIMIALIGLLAAMIWAYRTFGLATALLSGLFIIYDPCFLFISRHDWGAFAPAFLCRCCSLLFITDGWKKRSCWRFFAGGCFLGLGMYNKLDFSICIIAYGMALVFCALKPILIGVRIRLKQIAWGILGFIFGIFPILFFMVTRLHGITPLPGSLWDQWGEKLYAATSVLDGSYFERLILSGGIFGEEMYDVKGVITGPFLEVFICSLLILGIILLLKKNRGSVNVEYGFVFWASIFTIAGIFLLPHATRIHHMMNVYPFPHVVVAVIVFSLSKNGTGRHKLFRRILAVLLTVVVLAGNARVIGRTLSTIERTGGRGLWSDAIHSFAKELKHKPDAVVVSLDWGFHGQLLFENPPAKFLEPIRSIYQAQDQSVAWLCEGTAQYIYLIREHKYSVLLFHTPFLNAVYHLAPDIVTINTYHDREGEPVFKSVSIKRAHRLIYYNGKFQILLFGSQKDD